jgi:hypothetical protein
MAELEVLRAATGDREVTVKRKLAKYAGSSKEAPLSFVKRKRPRLGTSTASRDTRHGVESETVWLVEWPVSLALVHWHVPADVPR